MNDDGTRALERIANALELQAHMSAYRTYADDAEHYANISGIAKEEDLKKTFMEAANKNYDRAGHLSQRIDQLTGYTKEEDA